MYIHKSYISFKSKNLKIYVLNVCKTRNIIYYNFKKLPILDDPTELKRINLNRTRIFLPTVDFSIVTISCSFILLISLNDEVDLMVNLIL